MFRKLSFIFICINAFIFADCNSSETDSQTLLRLATLAAVLEDQEGSNLELSEERIYIDSQKIGITDQGIICYRTDQTTFLLPELFSDSKGCFVRCSNADLEMLSQTEELRYWWCSGCNRMRKMNKYGHCWACGRKL